MTLRRLLVLGALVAAVLSGGAAAGQALRLGQPAPEVTGAPWITGGPLSMQALRGRVVLVEFWTYGCVNCENVIPQLRAWHEKYGPTGLVVVGVHSPEFPWEKRRDKVVAATKRFGIRYPVVQDNDFAIWNRWGVRAWPTMLLVDRQGVVRYRHIGEGEYDETEAAIRRLIADPS